MSRFAVLAPVTLALALVLHPAPARADDADLVGTWEGEAEGFKEVITIRNEKGVWFVSAVYFTKDGKPAGSFRGDEVKLNGAALEFSRNYDKKPSNDFPDMLTITAKADKGKLTSSWHVSTGDGSRTLKKAEAPAASTSPLAGTWKGEVDGLKEVWTIKEEKGNYTIFIVYSKDDKVGGGAIGVDPRFAKDVLTFTQQWLKRPDGPSSAGGATVTVPAPKDGKITYTWRLGKKSSEHSLEAVK
jgi:hypothetical protein